MRLTTGPSRSRTPSSREMQAAERVGAAGRPDRVARVEQTGRNHGRGAEQARHIGQRKAADIIAGKVEHAEYLLLNALPFAEQAADAHIQGVAEEAQREQPEQRARNLKIGEIDDDRAGKRHVQHDPGDDGKRLRRQKAASAKQISNEYGGNQYAGSGHDFLHNDKV